MAKKTAAPKYLGGRKNLRGEMQKESQDGRREGNLAHKQAFKSGKQDGRDMEQRSPASQGESKRQPVTRSQSKGPAVLPE